MCSSSRGGKTSLGKDIFMDVVIYLCKKGSKAQKYANKNEYRYI